MLLKIRGCLYSTTFFGIFFMVGCGGQNLERRNIFRYNEQSGIATLDPAFAKNQSIMWAVHQLYNTLVETDSNLNLRPSLAKRWEISPDRLVYTFYLRDSVFFHNNEAFEGGRGRCCTAQDVEYSFKRIINKSTASNGAWIFNGRVDSIKGFKALNDSVFQLTLVRPFHPILGILSMQYCSIVAKEAVEKYGKDFRSHPCGTGPFELVGWEEGQSMILKRNNLYFEKDDGGARLPYLDGVKISFFDSKATEFLLFRQGQLDFVNDLEPSFKDEVISKNGQLKKEWQGKIVLDKHPYLNIEYLGLLVDTSNILVKNSAIRFKKIRQAMNYGFDRKKMMLYLRNSIGTPAQSGFIPAGLPSFDSTAVKGYYYDPQKAKQLIKESGYNLASMPSIKLLTIPIYADLASFIARELEEVGLAIKVEVVQKSLLLEQTAKSQAIFFRGSWIADYPDAENYLSVFYSKNPSPPNYTRYNNPQFDRWYEEALLATSDSIRYNLYRKMDQLVIDDAPVIPLWYDEVFHLLQPWLLGFPANGLNMLELRRVKK